MCIGYIMKKFNCAVMFPCERTNYFILLLLKCWLLLLLLTLFSQCVLMYETTNKHTCPQTIIITIMKTIQYEKKQKKKERGGEGKKKKKINHFFFFSTSLGSYTTISLTSTEKLQIEKIFFFLTHTNNKLNLYLIVVGSPYLFNVADATHPCLDKGPAAIFV